jgi:hypothetical protein
MAVAEITSPFSFIKTCTLTAPDAPTALAAGGYEGFGNDMALPFRIPPERVFGGSWAFASETSNPSARPQRMEVTIRFMRDPPKNKILTSKAN